jgi:hypothetical protein
MSSAGIRLEKVCSGETQEQISLEWAPARTNPEISKVILRNKEAKLVAVRRWMPGTSSD